MPRKTPSFLAGKLLLRCQSLSPTSPPPGGLPSCFSTYALGGSLYGYSFLPGSMEVLLPACTPLASAPWLPAPHGCKWVVGGLKCPLQLVQLVHGEGGAVPPVLLLGGLLAGCWPPPQPLAPCQGSGTWLLVSTWWDSSRTNSGETAGGTVGGGALSTCWVWGKMWRGFSLHGVLHSFCLPPVSLGQSWVISLCLCLHFLL